MDEKETDSYFRLLTDDFVIFFGKKSELRNLVAKMDANDRNNEAAGMGMLSAGEHQNNKGRGWFQQNPGYTTIILLAFIYAVKVILAG